MKDGRVKYVNERCETFYDKHGKAQRSFGTVFDITERKQVELALRRSQKMDAVGQMAGGIAHDFNNILGIILGNLHLLEKQVDSNEKIQKRIDSIKHSALRAADLTKSLLGFSSREPTNEKATNINLVISGMGDLIKQTLTPQVEVEQQFAKVLWNTRIDPGSFEDVLLNLVLNARDAMNGHGQLTIETCNVVLDNAYCTKNPDVKPGEYVQLAVSDNGKGISNEQQDHIFEPFFTTKQQGEGTGLGLAMVFGFIKRSGGYIKLYSEPGIGTTFHLYLPRDDTESVEQETDEQVVSLPRGCETLLIVDDEVSLVEIAEELLQSLGYRILTANNAKQALEQLNKDSAIDLLFSDVVMPGGLNGFDLAEQATAKYPQLKVLLTSGYSEKVIAQNGQAGFQTNLLNKPYTLANLAKRVRLLLDESTLDDG
jgi:nitrogen-specific signal transduction histidine kinase/CheY-like chemotaxis protein